MAETRGRDGEAVEVKSAGVVSPPAGGRGVGGLSRIFFLKMVRFGAFGDLFGCFFKCLKTSCLWDGEIIFHSPHPRLLDPFGSCFIL